MKFNLVVISSSPLAVTSLSLLRKNRMKYVEYFHKFSRDFNETRHANMDKLDSLMLQSVNTFLPSFVSAETKQFLFQMVDLCQRWAISNYIPLICIVLEVLISVTWAYCLFLFLT